MGTCISRPNRSHKSKNQLKYLQPHQSMHIQKIASNSQYLLQTKHKNNIDQSPITYPYYQPSWSPSLNYGHHGNFGHGSQGYCNVHISQILNRAISQNIYVQERSCMLSRYYSYSDPQIKKLFYNKLKENVSSKFKRVVEINGKTCVKIPLFQSLLFGQVKSPRIKISPDYEYIVCPGVATQQLSQQTQSLSFETVGMHYAPAVYHVFQNQRKEVVMNLVSGEQKVKKLYNMSKDYKKMSMAKNCLFNGILITLHDKYDKKSGGGNIGGSCQLQTIVREIFNQNVQWIQCKREIICYINPLLHPRGNEQVNNYMHLQYSTYLQLKCQIQAQKIDIINLFNPYIVLQYPKCELFCIYILLFCLKYAMSQNNQIQSASIVFLDQFIRMKIKKTGDKETCILKRVINIMIFCYNIGILHNKSSQSRRNPLNVPTSELARCCTKRILQTASINSHILIDAYLIQFGIQIDEKTVPIRQNPLIQLGESNPINYRFQISQSVNCQLVNRLRINRIRKYETLSKLTQINNYESHIQKSQSGIISVISKCQQQTYSAISQLFKVQTSQSSKSNQSTQHLQTPQKQKKHHNLFKLTNNLSNATNIMVIFESLLFIKIVKFLCVSQQITDFLHIVPAQLLMQTDKRKLNINIRPIKKLWQEIIDQFMNNSYFNYCSGQLAITILSLDSLVKIIELDQQNSQGCDQIQQSLKKALQIWFRIYRDPRAKYKAFLSNSWIIYIINILIKVKRKKPVDTHSTQSILYLQNILECFYTNEEVAQFGTPSPFQWVLNNLPAKNISGIFYNKIDLLSPTKDEKSVFLMRTGSSLIQTPIDLSSKSNYSEALSNTNSLFSKTNKKNRKRDLQIPQFSESKSLRNGVYIWGKGVNCSPLLYAFSKNLDVFKVACGNYHVVIATTIGIFGWGENSSGQIGQSHTKQPIRSIKKIYSKIIKTEKDVALSCGSQHTAILLKQQKLVMFGQIQGGIIAGNGHYFDSVSCGGLHTLGIKNGKVYSWGRGQGGQLGHKAQHLKTKTKQESTDFYIDSPKLIPNLPQIAKSVCGDAHSVLLTKQGDVYVFGFSYQGQLGLGITGQSDTFQIFQPVKLQFNTKNKIKIVDIFAGSTFTFFKASQGQIYSCGLNDCNQLGVQKMMKVFSKKKYLGQQRKNNEKKIGQLQFSRPNKIQIFNSQMRVNQIFCGQNHCLASVQYMKKNKMVMGWGLNKQLQISCQFPYDNLTPRTVDNIYDYNFSSFCCGSNFSLGIVDMSAQSRLTCRQLQINIQQILKQCISSWTLNGEFIK